MKEINGKAKNATASLIEEREKAKKIAKAKVLKNKISYGKNPKKRYESESPSEG